MLNLDANNTTSSVFVFLRIQYSNPAFPSALVEDGRYSSNPAQGDASMWRTVCQNSTRHGLYYQYTGDVAGHADHGICRF